MIKKVIFVSLVMIIIIAISTTTFAENKKSNVQMEKEIVDYIYQVNNSVGYHMTEDEIQTLS